MLIRSLRRRSCVLLACITLTPLTALAGARAAEQTALQDPVCVAIQPFYWEIGDAKGQHIGGGSPQNETDYTRDTSMTIASASKWWFGAYVIERTGGQLNADEMRGLRMLSGHHSMSYPSCLRLIRSRAEKQTVGECLLSGDNSLLTPNDVDRFDYNGGHFQNLAATTLGLGNANNAQLAGELQRVLGHGISIQYDSPQLAAGGVASAGSYAVFLQRLLDGSLRLGKMLGADAVCTQVGPACPTAVSSPIPPTEAWHYSFAHWVEDDPKIGDGAYSSPGAFGFYPWIDHDRRWYGILARHSLKPRAYAESVECGRLIRKAYLGKD